MRTRIVPYSPVSNLQLRPACRFHRTFDRTSGSVGTCGPTGSTVSTRLRTLLPVATRSICIDIDPLGNSKGRLLGERAFLVYFKLCARRLSCQHSRLRSESEASDIIAVIPPTHVRQLITISRAVHTLTYIPTYALQLEQAVQLPVSSILFAINVL